jgi:hypothetical protein
MKKILYLTDLYYQANGRKYYEEDVYITSKLKDHFNLLIVNPTQAISFIDCADIIVFRNTGPVIHYQEYFNAFLIAVKDHHVKTFNSFDGKADIKGKQYLLDLTKAGYPVIPTVDTTEDIHKLGSPDQYILKLKNGADSIGMQMISKAELLAIGSADKLIQPFLDFKYEVSFYYLNNKLQYALYAPDKHKRWELKEYQPTSDDLLFADRFIEWNNIQRGISRVDACRIKDGSLLLVELEDLNPFLSLDLLSEQNRGIFINGFIEELKRI